MADTMSERSGEDSGERNPFAPPPADAPDQPWRPRGPQSPEDASGEEHPPPHAWKPGQQGGWQTPPQPAQPKFDPNDPVQRRSRYALSAGMGGLFLSLYGELWPFALLLGALSVYWALSALRAEPSRTDSRPQIPAALGGLVTGGVAVLFVFAQLSLTVVYHDYVTCVSDAATLESKQSCDNLAPSFLLNMTNNPDAQ
jgi:hypothetical protein